jgi:hypothetical protein
MALGQLREPICRTFKHDAARKGEGKRAPFRMVQLCLGQPLLHLGRDRDVSREFFDLHNERVLFRLRRGKAVRASCTL